MPTATSIRLFGRPGDACDGARRCAARRGALVLVAALAFTAGCYSEYEPPRPPVPAPLPKAPPVGSPAPRALPPGEDPLARLPHDEEGLGRGPLGRAAVLLDRAILLTEQSQQRG